MSEESPAQKAARLRRERREAKIRDGGAARLDKITSLSGRTPASVREEDDPPTSVPGNITPSPPVEPEIAAPAALPPSQEESAEALRAQQEYIRALLRQAPAEEQAGVSSPLDEDPTMKMLNALMGGMAGGPGGLPGGIPGFPGDAAGGGGNGGDGNNGGTGFSPAALASMLGLPPFVASILGAVTGKESDEEKRQALVWKLLHTVFAMALGIYVLVLMSSSVATYGFPPPRPATAQNPFLAFLTGEMVLGGGRAVLGKGDAWSMGVKTVGDVMRDGKIVLLVFGLGSWWFGGWTS
ncbi:hypothetical protein ASPZODRAFT_91284 [Penicilliopsis zonata CBS 506.65]|uniref:GET complex, subunit GET2 n=1 Tax=Penicilliopsis zonata CBS 506.65 TaxID=1073090 RepID=A0A1L9SPE0_9EURO|nr:hypothetical protein ASPZODRAFT_91284 [Penicilliopsis zonata CBS 506.65]OJJ49058.1 hypothetical protein ASPZODRAFT_91284 [Penicilliopsis zonata CBS 506.65]